MSGPEVVGGGRYRIEETLGRGGMGAVHRAIDTTTGEAVALKQLRSDRTATRRERAELRFRREFHTLATLSHPRIIRVFDYFVDASGPFYTMELLDGSDLGKHLGTLSVRNACRVLRDVATALTRLHTRGLIHRDLAPRNVRITSNGRAKLIDFGVLANVGATGEVAGTLPYIAPESVRGVPLDGRADLYALGALGYALLTKTLPYAARRIEDLERVWQRPPTPPIDLVPDCPPQISELLLSLLCLDPLGRPTSAAEVIERLTAAADLEAVPEEELAHGFLASAAMVGRRREMRRANKAISRAMRSKGSAVFVSAESGAGKSRLLSEIEVEAKLAGAVAARVLCEVGTARPYGVIGALIEGLARLVPDDAREAMHPYAGAMLRVMPDLSKLVGPVEAAPAAIDPAEERLRIQRALSDAVLALAARRPLALIVDDLQWADEASAAVLASLARECEARQLLIVTALREGEPIRAPLAVTALSRARTRLELSGLDVDGVTELVRSLFGDVPRVARLAHALHQATNGSPLHCTELARLLVDDNVVRNVDGTWTLPNVVELGERPAMLAEAMEGRVRRLSGEARALAEVLAIVGGELPLELVVALAGKTEAHDDVFRLLDELAMEGVLVGEANVFRFRHDSLREALLRHLPEDRARTLHLEVAEALLEGSEGTDAREAEIGWHFQAGGDLPRAVHHLDRAGRRLFEAQALADCIPPLEAALALHDQLGSPKVRAREIVAMLLTAGWVSNRDVGLAHAPRAVREWHRHSGIALADRLGRFVGKHAALFLALAFTSVRWILTPRDRRGAGPIESIIAYSKSLGFACALFNASNQIDELRALVRFVAPFDVFPRRVIHATYLTLRSFEDILLGRLGLAADKLGRTIDILGTDRLTPMPEEERRFAEAVVRGLRALVDVNQMNPRMHEDLAIIDQLGFRYYRLVVQATLVVHHRYRGEEERARQIEQSMEPTTLALGAWSIDLQLLLFAHPAYALCHDVMGLKRCLDELERRVAEGMAFDNRVWMTKGEIARELGDFAESRACLARVWDAMAPDDGLFRQWCGSAIAETALASGAYDEAIEMARLVIALGEDEDVGVVLPRWRAERVLGLAEDALGHHHAAAERLERAIRATEAMDCPSLAGHMHEARARVALAGGDRATYHHHTSEAVRHFRGTNNPALIAVGERLIDLGTPRTHRAERTKPSISLPPPSSERSSAPSSTVVETNSNESATSIETATSESERTVADDASATVIELGPRRKKPKP